MRKRYPSDITREAYQEIEAELLAATKATKPRRYDMYDVFCAVLYVLKEGCTWRALPHDYPKWENCYYHFRMWQRADSNGETLFDRLLNKLVEASRKQSGREKKTTMIIVDSKSVKNADSAEEKGYDAGKKVKGRKRTLWLTPWATCFPSLFMPRISMTRNRE
jgi:transposase